MDKQKKIKILKSFDHGLQKPFYKKQRRENFKNIWFIEGLRPSLWTPLSKPFSSKKEDKKMDVQIKIKFLKKNS